MAEQLAYEIIEQDGRTLYRYPVNNFTTPHLRNIKRHIRKRDPNAVLELPDEEEAKAAVAPGWWGAKGVDAAENVAFELGADEEE